MKTEQMELKSGWAGNFFNFFKGNNFLELNFYKQKMKQKWKNFSYLGILILGIPVGGCNTEPELGVGGYGSSSGASDYYSGKTKLDQMRMDWLLVCFGNEPDNPETTVRLNEYLKGNPRQKYLVRLWPAYKMKHKDEKVSRDVTFLDYLYIPEVKNQIRDTLKKQIHVILDHIDNKDAVYGFTFLEELPFHFSDKAPDMTDPKKLPPDMILYKEQYEFETSTTLTEWNVEARIWWAKKFQTALNEINAFIKKESGGKKVFIWLAAHYRPLDWVKKGENLNSWRILPFYWKDLIKPETADGFFAYNNNSYWAEKYIELAEKNSWPYFSQLSQDSGMRLASWEECLAIARKKTPLNLGFFLYIDGNDAHCYWNDDPSIDENDNFPRASIVSHTRSLCAKLKVNMELVRDNLRPQISIDHELGRLPIGQFGSVFAVIQNPAESSWFTRETDTTVRNLKAMLELPTEFVILPENSSPQKVTIGEIPGGKHKIILWWVKRIAPDPVPGKIPIALKISCQKFDDMALQSSEPELQILPPESFEISGSGEKLLYGDFRIPWRTDRVSIIMECTQNSCTFPALFQGNRGLRLQDSLFPGDVLTIHPDKKATLKRKGEMSSKDVSARIAGVPLQLSKGMNLFTYQDMDMKNGGTKVKIKIIVEKVVPKIE